MLNYWIDAVVGRGDPSDEVLEEMRSGIDRHIDEWNDVGRTICGPFLAGGRARSTARHTASSARH